MIRLAKIYCLVSVVLSCGCVANLVSQLFGISTQPWMLILGIGYIAWLPISVIALVISILIDRLKLALCAASFAIFVIAHYFATSDIAGKTDTTVAICGLLFFAVYGIGNAYLLIKWKPEDPCKSGVSDGIAASVAADKN